ncbi:PASTA domain-containing protein [Actinokineospora auranticolor]|uniref:non-specific serine/threonine protein kinase n=1 Tax=Actinokineospora auranticolor TaxID=155976 RepID=A0A2S6GG91_9PSEU|nr:Stk1 family PASTA domain-containing Ser/Thr kinase [Actinokineospora auranticolor]PPK64166.1 serine/threonine-protein kinase [Actinokineospora auranticolor]
MEDKGPSLIGALLEQRYRVDAPLARGGMSAVYRGLDTRLDRPVAIKVMDSRFADDKTFVERFEREARSAAKIHHPNVVAVHDQGLDGEHVYLVMELVSGGTLRDLLNERGTLPTPLAVAIMEPVLSALSAAHRAGLIHRDVKPENVLIGPGGIVKVADFGLVRAVASAGTTKSSVILGTVSYLSPEQVTTGAATSRGDVYSAGIVLYETLTGMPPYYGDSALSVAYRHVNDDVPPPSASVPGIPPMLDELVVRATRRDPATRPEDGAAFLVELQRVRAALSLPRMRVPVPAPVSVDETMAVSGASVAAASHASHAGSLAPSTPAPSTPAPGTPVPAAPGTPAPGTPAPWASGPVPVAASGPVQGPVPASGGSIPPSPPPGTDPEDPETTVKVPLAAMSDALAKGPGDEDETVRTDATIHTAPPRHPHSGPTGFPQQQPVPHSATVVRQVPGFSAMGPQGTRAMLRSDLEKVIDSATANPAPRTGAHPVPYATGGVPVQPNTGPQAAAPRPASPTRRLVVLGIVGVLLLGLLGTGVWWFSSGRYTEVPALAGQEQAVAAEAARSANLTPRVTNQRDNKIEAGVVISTQPAAGTEALRGDEVTIVVSAGKPVVPDVRAGVAKEDAEKAVRTEQLQPRFDDGKNVYDDTVAKGKVVKLDPPAGTSLDIASPVFVVLSKGPAPKPVPDVKGRTRDEAFQVLSQAGFEPFDGPAEFSPDVEGGRVIRTTPGANTQVEAEGSKRVSVVVSSAVTVPDLTGRTVPEAQALLGQSGLVMDLGPFSNPSGRVFNQSPGAGSKLQRGDKVTAWLF